jgi:predicted CopG family antitoxin
MSTTKLRQIVVDDHNYKELKQLGHAGDSFNDVITQVLEIVKNRQNKIEVANG